MHLTAKIQQSYISLSSVNCDASLRTVNLKNRENACFYDVQILRNLWSFNSVREKYNLKKKKKKS